jgi:MFS family permease
MPSEPSLWRNRPFLLFTAGQTTSEAGSFLLMLAVLLHVYAATQSTRVTTVAFLAEMAPMVVLSSLAGVIADRLDRRRILIVADLCRAVLLLPLLVTTRIDLLIIALAGQSAVGAVFRPAYRAFVPSLVPNSQLAGANGVTSSTMAVLTLGCPALGAALFAAFGFNLLVVIDAATFLVSVATLWFVRPAYAVPAQRSEPTTVRADLVAGLRLLAGVPVFRLLVATGLLLSLFQGFLGPLIVPFFEGVLHATPTQVGFVASAQGASMLATGMLMSARGHRFRPGVLYVVGCWGFALIGLALALSPSYLFALATILLLGAPQVLFSVGEMTLLQTNVPDHLLGRAMGVFESALGVATVVGATAPAFATGLLGIRGVVVAGAGMCCVAAVVAAAGYGRMVSTETVTSSSTSGSTSGPTPGPDGTLMCPSSSTNGGVTSRA